MSYHLSNTRILYQNSKYAPVAVLDLELVIPTTGAFGLSWTQINEGLSQISTSSAGGPLSLTVEGSPLEHYCKLVLELQRYAGHPVQYARTSDAEHGYRVFMEYEDHATALYAGELAADLLNALMASEGSPDAEVIAGLQRDLDDYVTFAQARRLDPNTRLLMQAARRQDIPTLSLDQSWGMPTWWGAAEQTGIVQFGWGIHQQRCKGSLPLSFTSPGQLQQIADRAQWLPRVKGANLPLAGQDLEFINRNQVKRAQRSARRLGYPVTLRPRVTDPFQYRLADSRLFGPICNDEQVALVTNHLREQMGVDVWVESHVSGANYRFLILNKEVLSVVCCTPPMIIGDGIHSIAELIRKNAETADDAESQRIWHTLESNRNVMLRLQLASFNLDSVPASGEEITLSVSGTAYNGGDFDDVTETIPAHFQALALQVAKLTGLERLAGIDLTINDLSAPAAPPNCAVTDLTPAPDLLLHASADTIEDQYLKQLFPKDQPSRIPTVAVTGTNGKTTTCRMVTRILQAAGLKVGLSCTDGIYLDDELLVQGDKSGVLGANEVLADSKIEAAVLETARGNMANRGIAFDHCDVGACLNVEEEHLGDEGIETLDDMANHKRQVIERTTGTVVLNAENPRCLAMQTYSDAREVILIAHNVDHPAIQTHCQAGGKAIVTVSRASGDEICIVDSSGLRRLLSVNQIPATFDGKALFNVENAMAAIALAIGCGISIDTIINGLGSFSMSPDNTPGRMNIYDGLPFRLIADDAHNAHGLEAFCRYIRQLDIEGQRTAVFSVVGNRRDEEIKNSANAIADEFDNFICHDPTAPYLHGRKDGGVVALISSALLEHGIDEKKVQLVPDHEEAVMKALLNARLGDLLVLFFGLPFRLVVEDAHNVRALEDFCSYNRQLDIKGRRIVVFGVAGDCNDEEIERNTNMIADEFDYFYCHNSAVSNLDGRKNGKAALVKSALIEHGVKEESVEIIPNFEEAMKNAFSKIRPRDLLVRLMVHRFKDEV